MPQQQPPYTTADGGNMNLVNQDECAILDRVIAGVQITTAPGGAEDNSCARGVFRHASISES